MSFRNTELPKFHARALPTVATDPDEGQLRPWDKGIAFRALMASCRSYWVSNGENPFYLISEFEELMTLNLHSCPSNLTFHLCILIRGIRMNTDINLFGRKKFKRWYYLSYDRNFRRRSAGAVLSYFDS